MDTISLLVERRLPQDKPGELRRAGVVPGVIYGNKIENTSVKFKLKDFHSVYVKAGESTLVEVEVEGKKIPSLIHALSFEPVTGAYEHVDFYAVDMSKKVTTHVPLAFTGESPAVKNLGGVLVTVHDKITVTCLPQDLPHSFVVSLESLANFRDTITVGALAIPKGVTVAEAADMVLITVQEPRAEEVIAPVTPEAAAGAEGAAPAEGEAAAAGAAAPTAEKAAPAEEKGKKEKK